MAFFMSFWQIIDENPAFLVYPLVNGFVIGGEAREVDGESA
jgi:hypothetical protein